MKRRLLLVLLTLGLLHAVAGIVLVPSGRWLFAVLLVCIAAAFAVTLARGRKEYGLKYLVECTGVAARWCPIHGNCRCRRDDPMFDLNDPHCPLHAEDSPHGTGNLVVPEESPASRDAVPWRCPLPGCDKGEEYHSLALAVSHQAKAARLAQNR